MAGCCQMPSGMLVPRSTPAATNQRNAVGALGAVGRNLNQIARVAHQTGRVEGLTTADLRAILAAFEGLRAHFKRLIEANIASWETDHAKTSH